MGEPIRVLQIVGAMGTGGLETLIMNWYRLIDRGRVQFDFLVHRKEKSFYEDEIESLGGKVYHLSFSDDKNLIKYRRDLKNFFADHPEYRIVHGHHNSFGRFYLKAARDAGVPFRISHSHIASFSKTKQGYLIYILSRRFKTYANIHFACSRAAGDYMYGKGSDYTVINNGIDVEKFAFSEAMRKHVREEFNIGKGKMILHVGRFHHQKNHVFLIDVFECIHQKEPETVLYLAGTGELQDHIKHIVNEKNLSDSVYFLNSRNDIHDIMTGADLFILPSLYEGLPLTLVEAQASGLPVLCSDTITNETCLTSNYRAISLLKKPDIWADEAVSMMNQIIDRRNAYKDVKVAGYDSHDVVKMIEEYYSNLNNGMKGK